MNDTEQETKMPPTMTDIRNLRDAEAALAAARRELAAKDEALRNEASYLEVLVRSMRETPSIYKTSAHRGVASGIESCAARLAALTPEEPTP